MQAIGLARIGRDAELRRTTGGDAVVSLALAFTFGRKGADGKRQTQWVDASLWGKLGEALAQYLLKGTQVYVSMDDVHVSEYVKSDGTILHRLTGKIAQIELAGSSTKPAPKPAKKTEEYDMSDDSPF